MIYTTTIAFNVSERVFLLREYARADTRMRMYKVARGGLGEGDTHLLA